MKGDETEIETVYGKLQICLFVGEDVEAKYTREGDCHAEEGWVINSRVVSAICRVPSMRQCSRM